MKSSLSAALLGVGMLASGAALHAHEAPEFSMSVLVDGSPLPEYASRGRLYVEALKGREFTIRLTNPTSGRIAVALSVDGRNVIDARRTTESDAAKWVLSPGQTIEIPGWQVSGETSRRFFFTETSRSYAKWLGDTANVGTIEAVFFREKTRMPQPVVKDEAPTESKEGILRWLPGARSSAPEASVRQKAADEAAATGIGDKTRFPVQWVDFEEDPVPAARVAIRYEFHENLVRLGVLPRPGDDLASRERARGFEHDYAPDPYGHR